MDMTQELVWVLFVYKAYVYTRHLLFIQGALSSSIEESDQNNPEYSQLNQYHYESLLPQTDCFPDTVKVWTIGLMTSAI